MSILRSSAVSSTVFARMQFESDRKAMFRLKCGVFEKTATVKDQMELFANIPEDLSENGFSVIVSD